MERRILLFGGTTDGRELTRFGLPLIYSVATTYGAELVRGAENTVAVVGRMNAEEMEKFIRDSGIACVIDATHPYAREARENIRAACAAAGTPLMRVQRKESAADGDVVRVKSAEEAASYLEETTGNILLTTGSKELEAFARVSVRARLFARVLPDPEVIKKCAACGFDSGHIIAMQGPFSLRMNEEMIPFENMVADYVKETGNHVLYRVTPLFTGDELVARGVQMEALSVEDGGEGVCFNVYLYNVEEGVVIDYATGENHAA